MSGHSEKRNNNCGSPANETSLHSAKNRRVYEILQAYQNRDVNSKNKTQLLQEEVPKKKQKILKKSLNNIKKLQIGWKHKNKGSLQYQQGIGDFLYFWTGSYPYKVEEIQDLAVIAFKQKLKDEEYLNEPFEAIEIKFGAFNDTIIAEFTHKNRQPCFVWDYCREMGKPVYRHKFYLLTENSAQKEASAKDIENSVPSLDDVGNQRKTRFNTNQHGSHISIESISKLPSVNSTKFTRNSIGKCTLSQRQVTVDIEPEKLKPEEQNRTKYFHQTSTFDDQTDATDVIDEISEFIAVNSKAQILPNLLSQVGQGIEKTKKLVDRKKLIPKVQLATTIDVGDSEESFLISVSEGSNLGDSAREERHENEGMGTTEGQLQKTDDNIQQSPVNDSQQKTADDVRIDYVRIVESLYSKELSVVYMDKESLWRSLDPQSHTSTLDDFDPLTAGIPIGCIEYRNKRLLYIDYSSKSRKFEFPTQTSSSGNEHTILYTPKQLRGKCNGRYGVGAIPMRTDTCNPNFVWYKGGEKRMSAGFLYWIFVDESEADLWECVVTCSQKKNSGVPLNKVPHEETPKYTVTIPFVVRNVLTISRTLLGEGAQGKVRKGEWLQTPVAIKTVNYSLQNHHLISREIASLDMIRYHPNVIQVMAVCLEDKQIHIVMEYFESVTLFDLLFDNTTKEEFDVNIDLKNRICFQICLAINYLHSQSNLIYHCDLKPANFLVNSRGEVKLCDLGRSKHRVMATLMLSTRGFHSARGTPMYMAPELLLHNQSPTTESDIWGLGCTLVELYSEKSVWPIDEDTAQNSLQTFLANEVTPVLNSIPSDLRGIVEGCFHYNPTMRPKICDILKVITAMKK